MSPVKFTQSTVTPSTFDALCTSNCKMLNS